MKKNKYPPIVKKRREYSGGIIFSEKPAFVAYINREYADSYQIKETEGAILTKDIFSSPLDVHLSITTKCNMYCKGCYKIRKGEEEIDISFEKAKSVIDKLADMGVFSVSFGGGEPTLHPDLLEIASYAREKRILPNMTTNGLTMTEQFAEKCFVFGNVHFSIHTLHDMNYIFKAIQTYKNITGNKPGLNLLLTKETMPHMEEIINKAKKSGIKKVLFLRYKTTDNNIDVQGLCADRELEEFHLIIKKLQRANKQLMFLFDCSLFEILAEKGFLDKETCRKFDYNGCMGGNAYIAIDVNGMYKPCSFWNETCGDVLDLNFDNWIKNPALNEFRNMRKDDSCSCCEYEELCAGGCRLLHKRKMFFKS